MTCAPIPNDAVHIWIVLITGFLLFMLFLLGVNVKRAIYLNNGFCPVTVKRELPKLDHNDNDRWEWSDEWVKCPEAPAYVKQV